MEMNFQQADEKDVHELEQFLTGANVSTEGVKSNFNYYLLARNGEGEMIATVGLEPMKNIGLLRSFVFKPSFPYERIPALLQQILLVAKSHELHSVYLATNQQSSLPLFDTLGFREIEPQELPAVLYESAHGKLLASMDGCMFMYRPI
jgi:N-acetylglutamate synthase-like GNAT family acetyltransferase